MIKEPDQATRADLARSLIDNVLRIHRFVVSMRPSATSLYGVVLRHGVGRYGARLPRGMRRLAPKLCFQHATDLMRDDRFIYCEGYATRLSLGVVAGTHAWVLDRQDGWRVVDNTWQNPVEGVYLGIPFRAEYVTETILRKRTYGVIDNFEEDFPILKADPAEFLHPEAAAIPVDFCLPET